MSRILTSTRLFMLIMGFLMAVAVASGANAAWAQGDQPTDDEVNRIAKGLYCPVCENIPLDVCGTQACQQWRDLIRQKLAEGQTEAEIKAYFVEQYGERVLATPPARGLNWLVYVVPPLAILVGAGILIRVLRSWHRPTAAMEPFREASEDDPYIARLEDELRVRDRGGSEA